MYTNTLKGSGGSKAELTIGSIVPYLQFSVQITAVVITTTQTATSPPTPLMSTLLTPAAWPPLPEPASL